MRQRLQRSGATLLLVGVLSGAGALWAEQRLAGLDLASWTSDGGGGTSRGGGWTLSGTAGQPDAGTLSGGRWQLEGGFWASAPPGQRPVYLPLVQR